MPDRRIYVVGGDVGYANWLNGELVRRPEDANLCVLTGGEDCDPEIYGKKAHPTTAFNRRRDDFEIAVFKRIQELGLPTIGVCRGAQEICSLAGGILVQDSSHPYIHMIKTSDGDLLQCNSSHHQMQYPYDLAPEKYKLLAWAVDKNENDLSPYKWGESYKDSLMGSRDAEICFYPEIRGLAIQPHPEWLFPSRDEWHAKFVDYCDNLVVKYLNV